MISRSFSVPCSACKEPLFSPATYLECMHPVHIKCFENLALQAANCPKCDAKMNWIKKPEHYSLVILVGRKLELPTIEVLFHQAIAAGQKRTVVFLLDQGVSVEAKVENISPLNRACDNNREEIARLLLSHGAQLLGSEPLAAAAKAGNKELVQILVDHNVPLDGLDKSKRTPLFLAVHAGYEEIALCLIEKGARVDLTDSYGISLILMAVRSGLLKVVQELISRGVSVNEKSDNNLSDVTPVFAAAGKNNVDMLTLLIKNGGIYTLNTPWLGLTPLTCAISEGYPKNVKVLIEAGADLSVKYEGIELIEFAKQKLQKIKGFYTNKPDLKEEGDNLIRNSEEVVKILQEAMK